MEIEDADKLQKDFHFTDIGGLETQIRDLQEAIVLPIRHAHMFTNLGIQPPKGCLLYGAPGTGKTLLARVCAADTDSCFLKLAGPQLVQVRPPQVPRCHAPAFSFACGYNSFKSNAC